MTIITIIHNSPQIHNPDPQEQLGRLRLSAVTKSMLRVSLSSSFASSNLNEG
jgi:hypothetical protein